MCPFELPPELNIQILSYLPLSTLAALQRVDKQWFEFIDSNQSTIYRNAAWIHSWLPSPRTLFEDLDVEDEALRRRSCYSRRAMHGLKDWKGFCRRRVMIQRSWAGYAPSVVLPSPRFATTPLHYNIRLRTPYRRVHRIKVDEKIGIIMTTTQVGGLVVRDLENDDLLWELPTWYVRAYAHLEYGEGYMIFDRDDGNKEVWIRTQDVPAQPTLVTSFPDSRQRDIASRLAEPSSGCHHPRAQFTPYSLLVMPEHARAYRFVYPTLLVASTDRAYLWDIRTGELVQTLEGIQTVLPFAAQDLEPQGNPDDQQNGHVPAEGDEEGAESVSAKSAETSYHSDSSSDAAPLTSSSNTLSPTPGPAATSQQMLFDSDADDFNADVNEDEDEENDLPQFLGLLRYVEVSERHVVLVGRYLLRVFSRKTGRVVLDVPSTKWRYGAARWEVVSHRWAEREEGGSGKGDRKAKRKEKGKARLDSYAKARSEGREVVRMPVRFTFEEYRRSPRLLIDSFVAAHISSDGRHLAALLGGSRLIIIPDFESLCTPPAAPERLPIVPRSSSSGTPTQTLADALFGGAHPTLTPTTSASSTLTPAGTLTPTPHTTTTAPTQTRLLTPLHLLSPRALQEARRRMQRERDRRVFERTLDVQLGPPVGSSSVYLAFEEGRVGVVTTNAVYIVSMDSLLPAPECSSAGASSSSSSSPTPAIPRVTVSRLPYFSNPSWLDGVSCLMMSDTGMYLNWNPTDRDERDVWEREYERDLEVYEENEGDRYHLLPNGDMFVPRDARTLEPSEVSTVFTVNFAVADDDQQVLGDRYVG